MPKRAYPLALSILAFAAFAARPARAESLFATTRFEIAFSDGWQPMPALAAVDSANGSTLPLFYGYSMMGYCLLAAGPEGDAEVSARLDSFRESFAGGARAVQAEAGSATLGGREFAFVEYQTSGAGDSSGADTRFRAYAAEDGSLRFTAALIYDAHAAGNLVAELEAALGTLRFPSTPILSRARPAAPSRGRAGYDILGRPAPGALRTAAFLPPSR